MKTPNLHLVELWRGKILKTIIRYKGNKATPVLVKSIASELGLKLKPQATDHTREECDILDLNAALTESLVELIGGAVITDTLAEHAATRIAGLRDIVIIGKPALRFYRLPFNIKCHLRIISIEPRQDIQKYSITSEVLDGIPAGERVSSFLSRVALERVYRRIGLLGKRERRTISYKECLGKYLLCELGTRENRLFIKTIEKNQGVVNRNKKEVGKENHAKSLEKG